MKTAFKLVLIYLLVLQIIAPLLTLIPIAIYLFVTTGTVTQAALMSSFVAPAQLTGILMMTIYLWKSGYISRQREAWSFISARYMVLSVVVLLACTWLVSVLMSHLKWIPNIMEQTFNVLQSGWAGIFAITIAGPILEELLFRGAITKALLKQYDPVKAIVISALIFGVFHINPAQIIPAFFIGLLFGWLYFRTGSLIPVIAGHVLNNSLSVYLSIKFPDAEEVDDLVSGTPYLLVTCAAIVLVVGCYLLIKRTTVPCSW